MWMPVLAVARNAPGCHCTDTGLGIIKGVYESAASVRRTASGGAAGPALKTRVPNRSGRA